MKTLLLTLATCLISLAIFAMPTAEELEKVKPLVQDLMKSDLDAMKLGKKSRADVAKSAMSLYPQAESQAAKLLLARSAFNLYAKAGEYEAAEKALDALLSAVPDYPALEQAELLEKALYPIPYKSAPNLRARLAAIKEKAQAAGQLKSLLSGFDALPEGPKRKAVATRIAISYVSLGDWPNAVKYFALSDSPAASAAQEELKLAGEPEATRSYDKAANAWWSVELPKLALSFRAHSAELYSKALPSLTGLAKVQADRRIKEYEAEQAAIKANLQAKSSQTASSSIPSVGTAKYYGVELVGGSVKENKGILSDFANHSYAKIKAPFDPKDKSFEVVVEFTTGQHIDTVGGILIGLGPRNGYSPLFISRQKLSGFLSSDGTTWNIAGNVPVGDILKPMTTYLVKSTWDRKAYSWYLYKGNAWAKEAVVLNEFPVAATELQFGTNRGEGYPFSGTVNLNKSYICIDGKVWWEGVKGAYKNANR